MFHDKRKNLMAKKFPHYLQLDTTDCGPTCLRMIAKFYGRSYSLNFLREKSYLSREGVSMLGISDAATAIGFRSSGVKITIDKLIEEKPFPCILHWNQNHFVVCYKIKNKRKKRKFYIADPANEIVEYTEDELRKCWLNEDSATNLDKAGLALLLEPGPSFYDKTFGLEKENGVGRMYLQNI